jgi:hypothetical protein
MAKAEVHQARLSWAAAAAAAASNPPQGGGAASTELSTANATAGHLRSETIKLNSASFDLLFGVWAQP